jgi:recombinational DNA repair protein RecR
MNYILAQKQEYKALYVVLVEHVSAQNAKDEAINLSKLKFKK